MSYRKTKETKKQRNNAKKEGFCPLFFDEIFQILGGEDGEDGLLIF